MNTELVRYSDSYCIFDSICNKQEGFFFVWVKNNCYGQEDDNKEVRWMERGEIREKSKEKRGKNNIWKRERRKGEDKERENIFGGERERERERENGETKKHVLSARHKT